MFWTQTILCSEILGTVWAFVLGSINAKFAFSKSQNTTFWALVSGFNCCQVAILRLTSGLVWAFTLGCNIPAKPKTVPVAATFFEYICWGPTLPGRKLCCHTTIIPDWLSPSLAFDSSVAIAFTGPNAPDVMFLMYMFWYPFDGLVCCHVTTSIKISGLDWSREFAATTWVFPVFMFLTQTFDIAVVASYCSHTTLGPEELTCEFAWGPVGTVAPTVAFVLTGVAADAAPTNIKATTNAANNIIILRCITLTSV